MKVTIWREEDQLIPQAGAKIALRRAIEIYPESKTNFFLKITDSQVNSLRMTKEK
jgi:hypothetical protein